MISNNIKCLRQIKNITISELVEKSGVSKSYVSSIEQGTLANPSVQSIEKIATVLGVTVDELIFEDCSQIDALLDEEWLEVVHEAMESDITKEQFREYLEYYIN